MIIFFLERARSDIDMPLQYRSNAVILYVQIVIHEDKHEFRFMENSMPTSTFD